MAYLNEFPHVEASQLNLDWLLEQYRTFNDRLAEVQAHFDEVAAAMEESNNAFKNSINLAFNQFKDDVNGQIATINNAIEQVSNNVEEFVEEHMGEWQVDAMTGEDNEVIIGDYDPEEPITDGGVTTEIIVNNTRLLLGDIYKIGGGYLVSLSKATLTDNNYGTVRLIETNSFKNAFPEYYQRMKDSEYTTIDFGYIPLPIPEQFTSVVRSGLAITRITATRSTTNDDFGFWLSWTRCNDSEGNNAIANLVNDVVLNFYVILHNELIGETS